MKEFLAFCTFLLVVLFLTQAAYLVFDGCHDNLDPSDAILVLGSKVKPDGTLSSRLKARLDRGYELYRDGFSSKIIVSGGVGKEGYSEAQVMATYLKGLGIPPGNMLLDEAGNTTWRSALNFKHMADAKGFHSVILVSQYFHLTRAKLAFRKAGIAQVYSAHARMVPEIREIYSVPREVIALDYYLVR